MNFIPVKVSTLYIKNLKEVERQIRKLKKRKAPGRDGDGVQNEEWWREWWN
jgi:hypothetical protein